MIPSDPKWSEGKYTFSLRESVEILISPILMLLYLILIMSFIAYYMLGVL